MPDVGPVVRYDARQQSDGKWSIMDVPVFSEVAEGGNGNHPAVDREWLEMALAKDQARRATGYRAPMHIRHHGMEVADRAGEFALTELRPFTVDGESRWTLFANLINIPDEVFQRIADGELPHRSVEILSFDPPEVSSLALLDSEPPYFRYPNLAVGQRSREPALSSFKAQGPGGTFFIATKPEDRMTVQTTVVDDPIVTPPETPKADDEMLVVGPDGEARFQSPDVVVVPNGDDDDDESDGDDSGDEMSDDEQQAPPPPPPPAAESDEGETDDERDADDKSDAQAAALDAQQSMMAEFGMSIARVEALLSVLVQAVTGGGADVAGAGTPVTTPYRAGGDQPAPQTPSDDIDAAFAAADSSGETEDADSLGEGDSGTDDTPDGAASELGVGDAEPSQNDESGVESGAANFGAREAELLARECALTERETQMSNKTAAEARFAAAMESLSEFHLSKATEERLRQVCERGDDVVTVFVDTLKSALPKAPPTALSDSVVSGPNGDESFPEEVRSYQQHDPAKFEAAKRAYGHWRSLEAAGRAPACGLASFLKFNVSDDPNIK